MKNTLTTKKNIHYIHFLWLKIGIPLGVIVNTLWGQGLTTPGTQQIYGYLIDTEMYSQTHAYQTVINMNMKSYVMLTMLQ